MFKTFETGPIKSIYIHGKTTPHFEGDFIKIVIGERTQDGGTIYGAYQVCAGKLEFCMNWALDWALKLAVDKDLQRQYRVSL